MSAPGSRRAPGAPERDIEPGPDPPASPHPGGSPRAERHRGEVQGLRFRVTDLRRSPGSRWHEQRVVEPGELAIGEVRVDPAPVTVVVDMESMSDGVRVRATVSFGWEGPCRRCLETATGRADSEILELFVDDPEVYTGTDLDDVGWEIRPLEDGWVDMWASVRDALLLGLPIAPLCRDDCEGPSPELFPVEVSPEEAEPLGGPAGDPRWAALDELRFDPGEA